LILKNFFEEVEKVEALGLLLEVLIGILIEILIGIFIEKVDCISVIESFISMSNRRSSSR
jgi:hypothetical protein